MIHRSHRTVSSSSRKKLGQLTLEKLEDRYLLSVNPVIMGPEPQTAEQVARQHLAAAEDTAYLQQDRIDLQLVNESHDNGNDTFVFQQTIDGLPINRAYVTVVQGTWGELRDVFDHGRDGLIAQMDARPQISLERAEQIASEYISTPTEASMAELVLFPTGKQATLAWQVTTGSVGDQTSTIVDAHHGEVLSTEHIGDDYLEQFASDTGIFSRIVINNTIGPAGSRAYAAPFDAVAELSQGCTGTLIAEDMVIAARHCGSGSQVRFGDNGNSPVYIAQVAQTTFPAGGGSLLDGGDVSLVRLTQPVPSNVATPMRLIDEGSALVGEVAATLGYGFNGVGSQGHGFSADGFRWGGENIIDRYGTPAGAGGSNIFSTDFDDGSSGNNTIGGSDPVPLEFEATTAPGDSGGPLLVEVNGEWLIAGVLSGGTTSNSVYGDISWWTGVTPFRTQIENAGGEFLGAGAGEIELDKAVYGLNDTIQITVDDPNGINPLEVTLTSDSGDSETFTLTPSGGSTYTGSMMTGGGAAATDDGVLQVSLLDEIQVTYNDPDDGSGGPLTVMDTALIANVVNFQSVDVPVNIPNEQTITSELVITDAGNILDLDVQVDITHNFTADLDVFLIAPDGTRVELFTDVGSSGDNFDNTILDDEASISITQGSAPFVGSYAPEGDLSDFDGMSVTGTWTLEITDDFRVDDGTLDGWGISAILEGTTLAGDFDGNGIYDCDDIDALTNEIAAGTNDPAFDLTNDGMVDTADRDAWLLEAGEANLGPGRAYLLGDANLDGVVDAIDFTNWNNNKFTANANWCDGDFNADGFVDAQDFTLWNDNKFQSADGLALIAGGSQEDASGNRAEQQTLPMAFAVTPSNATPQLQAHHVDQAFSQAARHHDGNVDESNELPAWLQA